MISLNTRSTMKRKDAIKWWNKLSFENKFYEVIAWLKSKGLDTTSRHVNNLTGTEIEELYERAHETKTRV